MKKFHILEFLTLWAIALTLSTLSFDSIAKNQNGEEIIIEQETEDPIGPPRTPAANPFYAYLMNSYVLLGSRSTIGDVSVSLTSTAGDNYSTVFDTEDGSIIIPISGYAGDYTLQLTDGSGTHFIGEFEI